METEPLTKEFPPTDHEKAALAEILQILRSPQLPTQILVGKSPVHL